MMMSLMETDDDDVVVDDLAVNNGKGVHPDSPTSVFELDRVVQEHPGDSFVDDHYD